MDQEIIMRAAMQQLRKIEWKYHHTNAQGHKVWMKDGQEFILAMKNLRNLPQH